MKRVGLMVLAVVAIAAVLAPWLAPNPPNRRHADLLLAPPTRVHIYDGGFTAPYIHPWRLVSRLEYRFEELQSARVPLRWLTGSLMSTGDDARAPLLLLGADSYERDIFSRLVHGARVSLLLALVATIAATLLGAAIGGATGYAGGWIDAALSRVSEFVLVLPAIYVALALRAVMPLILPPATVFVLLAVIFTLFGWPIVARGVRAIVVTERGREYAEAAHAAGAGHTRILTHHLLPAARGYIATQAD